MTHYFDHAATTAMRPAALSAWEQAARQLGNASAIHGAGRANRQVVEEARETILETLTSPGASRSRTPQPQLIFTSGGTEADNLAVIGLARARRRAEPERTTVLVSPIEHHGVLDAAHSLTREGFDVIEMPLTERGVVNAAATADLMRLHAADLAVASLMAVNNETGIVQPAARLAEVARQESGIPFHCDMVQAHGLTPAPPTDSGSTPTSDPAGTPHQAGPASGQPLPLPGVAETPDLSAGWCSAAFAAHKLGGPMGVGALLLPRGFSLEPTSFGAGQEARLRSGTLPVPLIASFAAAVRQATEQHSAEQARLAKLTARLTRLLEAVGATIVGQAVPRTPAITYALFPGCLGADLVVLLDALGIFVSTGSACTAGVPQASHVLLAMGYSEDEARSGLRFSLGWTSDQADLDALEAALPEVVERAQRPNRGPVR